MSPCRSSFFFRALRARSRVALFGLNSKGSSACTVQGVCTSGTTKLRSLRKNPGKTTRRGAKKCTMQCHAIVPREWCVQLWGGKDKDVYCFFISNLPTEPHDMFQIWCNASLKRQWWFCCNFQCLQLNHGSITKWGAKFPPLILSTVFPKVIKWGYTVFLNKPSLELLQSHIAFDDV